MSNGIRTTNLERSFVIDELLGNITEDGVEKTARLPIEALASQLAGTGPFVFGNTVYVLTRAQLDAYTPPNEQMGGVVLTGADAGYYARSAGVWVLGRGFPDTLAKLTVTGGTANAVQARTAPGVNPSLVTAFYIDIADINTAPITISINGAPAIPALNFEGEQFAPGEWNGRLLLTKEGSFLQALTADPATIAAAVAITGAARIAAEAAAAEAAAYADFARNNWAAIGPFNGIGIEQDYPLSIDPGSVNNMFVVVGGVTQLITQSSYSLVYSGSDPFIRINVPLDVPFEVRVSNAIDVNTPSDGSVSTEKMPDKAVTYAKIQDVSATTRLLGRVSSGAGPVEEITAAQLRTLFLPDGAVLQSVAAEYTTNAAITTVIPADDTIPQSSEGTEVISLAITPLSATSKLRLRLVGEVSRADAGPVVWAVFRDAGAAAVAAGYVTIPGINFASQICGSRDVAAGSTALQTFKVRVGPGTAGTIRFNGTAGSRLFGGIASLSFVIEEVK